MCVHLSIYLYIYMYIYIYIYLYVYVCIVLELLKGVVNPPLGLPNFIALCCNSLPFGVRYSGVTTEIDGALALRTVHWGDPLLTGGHNCSDFHHVRECFHHEFSYSNGKWWKYEHFSTTTLQYVHEMFVEFSYFHHFPCLSMVSFLGSAHGPGSPVLAPCSAFGCDVWLRVSQLRGRVLRFVCWFDPRWCPPSYKWVIIP